MSSKLMTALESCPVNLNTTVGLTPVCIDNEEVREQILTANKIDISTVPCVLIVYRTGGVEKYEGGSAFHWIDETVRKHMPPPPPQMPAAPQPVQKPLSPQPQPRRKRPRRPEPEYYEEEYESSEEDYIPEPPRRKRPKKRPSLRKPIDEPQGTSMEDLGLPPDDEEPIQQESNIPPRPPVGVRSGPGGYDMTSEFGEMQEPNRDASRHMRPSTQPATGKGNDLMAAAMAMQKEREAVDVKQPHAVGNVSTNQRPI